jgi:nitronate monooxygenase/enoyl-[acyl-carrier protein] reductase II
MLHTPLCGLLGIDHPIIQAGMGPFGSGAELAAAVSNAGALGSLGGAARPVDDLREQLARLLDLTSRPLPSTSRSRGSSGARSPSMSPSRPSRR